MLPHSSIPTLALVVDADYLYAYVNKFQKDLVYSLKTSAGVTALLDKIAFYLSSYIGRVKLSASSFIRKHLLCSVVDTTLLSSVINVGSWIDFVIHKNVVKSSDYTYYCNNCGRKQTLCNKAIALTSTTVVSLSEAIITALNENYQKPPDSGLVIIGVNSEYEFMLDLAKKYKAEVFVLGLKEDIRGINHQNFFDLRNVLHNQLNANDVQIPFSCISTPRESLPDYAIGIKGVPVNTNKEAFKDLLKNSAHEPVFMQWAKDREHDGCFVKLYYNKEKDASEAMKFVLIINELLNPGQAVWWKGHIKERQKHPHPIFAKTPIEEAIPKRLAKPTPIKYEEDKGHEKVSYSQSSSDAKLDLIHLPQKPLAKPEVYPPLYKSSSKLVPEKALSVPKPAERSKSSLQPAEEMLVERRLQAFYVTNDPPPSTTPQEVCQSCCLCCEEIHDELYYPSLELSCGHRAHNFCTAGKEAGVYQFDQCYICDRPISMSERNIAFNMLTPHQ